MQFYPPGWAPWPAGIGCTANQWCAALNIDTFSENQNTGQFNNTACLNTVGPEPVNFAFVTKNGVATAPANPQHPEHFVPDPKRDFLMRSGDNITVHLFDTPSGLRVVIQDLTTHTRGSMTASAANGFGNVVFDPSATTCQVNPYNFHPEFSTSTPQTRNVAAAHTYNVAFSDEIGHFEYCAKVGTDPNSTCLQPLGADTNDGDTAGPDPAGDDDFCLPASASLKVRIGGCLDIDGDFDGVSYNFTWPGSISNPVADRLLNPRSFLFTSPTVRGRNFTSMAFESDISRNESDDTAFRVDTPCQRHVLNPGVPRGDGYQQGLGARDVQAGAGARPDRGRAPARLGGAGRAGPSGSRAPGGRMPRSDGAGGQQKRDSNPGNSLRPFMASSSRACRILTRQPRSRFPRVQDREPCSGSRAVPGSTAHRYAAASSNPSRARTGFLPRSTTR
jgi:hypothetical protein